MIIICNKTHRRRCIWTNTTAQTRVRAHPHTLRRTSVKHSILASLNSGSTHTSQYYYYLNVIKRQNCYYINLILKLLPTDLIILSCWYPANFLRLPAGHRLRIRSSRASDNDPAGTHHDVTDLLDSMKQWPPPDTLRLTRWSNRYNR